MSGKTETYVCRACGGREIEDDATAPLFLPPEFPLKKSEHFRFCLDCRNFYTVEVTP